MPKLAHIAAKIGLVDHPNARKVHKTPKPLIGGIGIVISIALASLFFLPLAELQGFFAGLTILSFIITIFCTVGVVNTLNMIDGLDGLAGGLSFIAFIGFAVIAAMVRP